MSELMNLQWLTTASERVFAYAPRLLAALAIFVIGYVIARVLGRVTAGVARRVGIGRLVARLSIFRAPPEPEVTAHWLGRAVYFFGMVVTLLQVAETLELTWVARGLSRFIEYLPNVAAAFVALVVAVAVGDWARARLARSATLFGGVASRVSALGSGVRFALITIGVFVALRELEIAPALVDAAFMMTLGAMALAGALAFGLGGRDVAGKIASSWYERKQNITPRYEPANGSSAEAHSH